MSLYRGKTEESIFAFSNVWVEGDLIKSKDNYYIHPQSNSFEVVKGLSKLLVLHKVRSDTIVRCVGLKDKNNNDIFVGDILKNEWNELFLVVDEKLRIVLRDKKNRVHTWKYVNKMIVIGNKHDNSELLKEQL